MSGQSAMKTVKEVKATIKKMEHNCQYSGGSSEGKEMNKQYGGTKTIGKK